MKKTQSAGGVITNTEGKIVIVMQNDNSWSLPKGHIDPGETKLQAAKREIYEETGIKKLKYVKKLGTYSRYRIGLHKPENKSELKTITFYHFKTKQKKLCPSDKKNPKAKWVDKKNVTKYLTHKKDKEFFLGILDRI